MLRGETGRLRRLDVLSDETAGGVQLGGIRQGFGLLSWPRWPRAHWRPQLWLRVTGGLHLPGDHLLGSEDLVSVVVDGDFPARPGPALQALRGTQLRAAGGAGGAAARHRHGPRGHRGSLQLLLR